MINPFSTIQMAEAYICDFPLNNTQSIRGSSCFSTRMEDKFIELHIYGSSENTKHENIYDPELGSEFGGMIFDVVDVDVDMQRFDGCSGGNDLDTFRQIFPLSVELHFVHVRVFFTSTEMQGADIRKDAFRWCPRIFEKRIRIGVAGSPQFNFTP